MHILHRTFGAAILRAPDDAAATGPLSVDAAVALLRDAPAAEAEAPAEPVEAQADDPAGAETGDTDTPSEAAAQTADDAAAPLEASDGDEADPPEPDLPAIEPPHFWAADDKAAFAEAPRHVQEKIVAYEAQRTAAASKAIQEAAEARKAAETARQTAEKEASSLAAFAETKAKLDKLIPDAEGEFKQRWGENPDWVGAYNHLITQHGAEQGPAQYAALRAQYDAEVQNLQQLRTAKQDADKLADQAKQQASEREAEDHRTFVQAEYDKLKAIEPELTDPKHGDERRAAVAKFLTDNGVAPDQLRWAGAAELALAYDAMRYRQGKAAAATALAPPKPKPTPAAPAVRPSAPPPAVPQAARRAQEAESRLNRSGKVDDAVALLRARRGTG